MLPSSPRATRQIASQADVEAPAAVGIQAGLPGNDQETSDTERTAFIRYRRLFLITIIGIALITPAITQVRQHGATAQTAFLLAGTLVFVLLIRQALIRPPGVTGPVPWP